MATGEIIEAEGIFSASAKKESANDEKGEKLMETLSVSEDEFSFSDLDFPVADAKKPQEVKTHGKTRMIEFVHIHRYDDLFSDFDYGPYEEQRVSEDLLVELEHRLKYAMPGKLEIVFVLPDGARKKPLESMIRKRVRQVFELKQRFADAELKHRRKSGWYNLVIGFFLIAIEWIFVAYTEVKSIYNLIGMLLTPAAWMFTFNGFERLLQVPQDVQRKHIIYTLLHESSIFFIEESKFAKRTEPSKESAQTQPKSPEDTAPPWVVQDQKAK